MNLNKTGLILFAGGLAVVVASTYAKADDLKIGIVDMQKALQTVSSGKKAKSTMEKEIKSKEKDIQTEEAALKKITEDFKKQSLVLSDEARNKKQNEIQERIMKYQEMRGRAQTDLQQRELELTRPLIEKLKVIISDLAKKKGYSMVLEKNEQTVLFSQDKDDMTSDVVSIFDKQNQS